jgi:NAD(P)-dependent dehydrogenase (short-subunit alcohol dehydrogenase family)
MSGLLGNFGQANYAAAKAGIYGLTRTLALELARAQVTVNALAPIALTRMTADLPAFAGGSGADELAPEHVAPVALFLASAAAGHITGQVVGVEGRHVFLYRMERGEGLTRSEAEGAWTPELLGKAWEEMARR